MIDLINKKDDSITILEFQKVKNYPTYAYTSLILGFIVGLVIYYFTRQVWYIFVATIIGAAIYSYFAFNYRCPDCRSFLWFLKNKNKIRRCPKCQAKLREDRR